MTCPDHNKELERLVDALVEASYKHGYEQAGFDDGAYGDVETAKQQAQDARLALIQEVQRSHYCCICGRTLDELGDVKP